MDAQQIKYGYVDPILIIHKLFLYFEHNAGNIEALLGVSLTLRRGEILALIGESGCGKSVLLKAIPGLNSKRARLKDGRVLFYPRSQSKGIELSALTSKQLRRVRGSLIGTVFQDSAASLNPAVATGRQLEAQIMRQAGLSQAQARSRLVELLSSLDLKDPQRISALPPQLLSGGERQRCCLALALAGSIELLLADEITTALDPTVQLTLLRLLLKLKERFSLSVLLITHNLGVAAAVADRIGIMYAGRIVEIGTAAEICENPQHPYTRTLFAALPERAKRGEELPTITGSAPVLINPPSGDLFARRDPCPLRIDFIKAPPFFALSPTHMVATWRLHPAVCGQNYPVLEELS